MAGDFVLYGIIIYVYRHGILQRTTIQIWHKVYIFIYRLLICSRKLISTITEWRNNITYAYIHNDSTVEITRCGKLIASFRELTSGRFEIRKRTLP